MCGRFDIHVPKGTVEGRFDARFVVDYQPRYNAAPSQDLPVVRDVAAEEITAAEWGLKPAWAETREDGGFINARAESAAEKRSFRAAMAGPSGGDETTASGGDEDLDNPAAGRCLVPATGFYEWADEDGGRQPYRLHVPDDEVFAMAGLWTRWSPERRQAGLAEFGGAGDRADEDGQRESVLTFAILTTEPNEVASTVHDRMPAILSPGDEETWLTADRERARELLGPYGGRMDAYPVSTEVNDPANDRPSMIRSIEG